MMGVVAGCCLRFFKLAAAGESEAALDGKVGPAVLIGLAEQQAHTHQAGFAR
jgi:hypothetical protein